MKIKTREKFIARSLALDLREKEADLDSVTLHHEDEANFFPDGVPDKIVYVPFLERGVLITYYGNSVYKTFWDCEYENENVIIQLHTMREDTPPIYIYNMQLSVPFVGTEYFTLELSKYADAHTQAMHAAGIREREIEDYVNEVMDSKIYDGSVTQFMRVMAWINYLLENPTYKTVTKDHTDRVTMNAGQPHFLSNRTIDLNRLKISTKSKKVYSAIGSGKIHRTAECWSVRGHMRHYKDGKVVYVRPYEKGKGRKSKRTYDV